MSVEWLQIIEIYVTFISGTDVEAAVLYYIMYVCVYTGSFMQDAEKILKQ